MNWTWESMLAFIKANFFYDLRSTVLTICVVVATFYFIKLMKYNGEKTNKTLSYLMCLALPFAVIVFLI